MAAIEGVVHAREIGADGAVRAIDLAEADGPCAGWRLIHLGRDSLEARDWLLARSGLSENAVYAMLEDDTRPRAAAMDGGVLLILRGVSLDAEGRFDSMVSTRLFVTERRVIGVQRRALATYEARVAALDAGEGTEGVGAFVAGLIEALRKDAEPVLDMLETAVDAFELSAFERPGPPSARERNRLNAARHDTVLIRRHIAPQGDAIRALLAARPGWLDDEQRGSLREEADAFRRMAEDLDALRQRAFIVSDEAALRVGEETNRLILRLSVVSIIFLPLTFFTGLLGVNLAGIPWAEEGWAFAAFALSLIAFAGFLVALLRRKGLL